MSDLVFPAPPSGPGQLFQSWTWDGSKWKIIFRDVMLLDGSQPMSGELLLAGNATSPLGAVPLQQLQLYLPLAGNATMTGPYNLSGNATQPLQPVAFQQLGAYLPRDGSQPMTGPLILSGTTTNPNAAITYGQAQSLAAGGDFLPLTGGQLRNPGGLTMDGFLGVGTPTQSTGIEICGASGQTRPLVFMTGGWATTNVRWSIYANDTPETGGNAGSDLAILRYSDTGVALSADLIISRVNGLAQFSNMLVSNSIASPLPANAALTHGLFSTNIAVTGVGINCYINTAGTAWIARSATLGSMLMGCNANGQLYVNVMGVSAAGTAVGGYQYIFGPGGTFNANSISTAGYAAGVQFQMSNSSYLYSDGNIFRMSFSSEASPYRFEYTRSSGVWGAINAANTTTWWVNMVNGNTSQSGTMTVGQAASIGGTLTVSGSLFPNGSIQNIQGYGGFSLWVAAGVGPTLGFAANCYAQYSGNLVIVNQNGVLNLTGASGIGLMSPTTCASNLQVNGGQTNLSNLQVNGAITCSSSATINGNVTFGNIVTGPLHQVTSTGIMWTAWGSPNWIGISWNGTNLDHYVNAGFIGSWSDIRYKTVEGDYPKGLAQLRTVRPILFRYKGNDHHPDHPNVRDTETQFVGIVAQDNEQTFPELFQRRKGWIDGEEVDDVRSIDRLDPLVFALVNAVRELADRVEQLEKRTH